jgi:hypothetical protein
LCQQIGWRKSRNPASRRPGKIVDPSKQLVGFNYQADPVSLALVYAKSGKLPKDWSTDDPSASSATRSRAGR